MVAVCGVQCTSCTECDLVLVVCITDAAPILTEQEYMHGGAYGVGSMYDIIVLIFSIIVNFSRGAKKANLSSFLVWGLVCGPSEQFVLTKGPL